MEKTATTATNIKAILRINKKALQGLHYIRGYDFTKPFDVIRGKGKYTLNSIKKECKLLEINIENVAATLLIQHNKYATFHRKLHIVDISNFIKFNYYASNKEIKSWEFDFDVYCGIGEFETYRKNMTETWFVIIQNKNYLVSSHIERVVDYTGRLKSIKPYTRWRSQDGTKGRFFQGEFKQDNQIFYIDNHFRTTVDEPLDKSGYWLPHWKSELEQKLNTYKIKKRKYEADNYIFTSDIIKETTEIKEKVNELKQILAEMILNDKYKIVEKVMYKYARICEWLKQFDEKLANKKYKSISDIRYDINYISQYYNEIMEIVNTDQTDKQED